MTEEMSFQDLVAEAKARIHEVTVEEARAAAMGPEAALLLDVREESEFAAGHAAGAMHLGRGILERDAEKRIPNKATPIVAYCGGGSRSALAADTLRRMGYHNVMSMIGGWKAWSAKGLPVDK